jgi:hypothetical protein
MIKSSRQPIQPLFRGQREGFDYVPVGFTAAMATIGIK